MAAITMKDIARHCGLSGGAVSQVLRNPDNPRFSPKTRELILETAAKLDYRQNPLSRALRTSKTNLIGLMLPWNEPEVMDCIERVACENGYKLLIQFTAYPRSGLELEALKSFLDWNVDGIIWEPSGMTDDNIRSLLNIIRKEGPPLVMLERVFNGVEFPVIFTDFDPVMKECARHLKEKKYGKIVFVSNIDRSDVLDDKIENIKIAALECDLDFSVCYLGTTNLSAPDEICNILIDPRNTNTCYCCYSWLISDFVDAAETLKIRVPEDIGLVMLLDLLIAGRLRVSNLLRPKITAIRVNGAELAEMAVNRLLSEIRNETISQTVPLNNQAELVIQSSTNRVL